MDEQYSSGVLGVPLKVLQEELRQRAASRSFVGLSTSAQPSFPSSSEEEDILYCCTMDISSKIDEKRLYPLRDKYQISDEVNPRLATPGEWCCTSNSGVVIYKAYLLGGLRLPLNAFSRELLHRLGIGLNQLNPDA